MNNYDYVQIVNSVNKEMNGMYDYKFPIFEDNNFKAMSAALVNAPDIVKNAYVETMINTVTAGVIKKIYSSNNIFKFLYGRGVSSEQVAGIEKQGIKIEYALDRFIPAAYKKSADPEKFFESMPPKVKTQVLWNVLRKVYTFSVNRHLLIAAFNEMGGVENLLDKALQRLYADMEEDDKEEILAALDGVVEGGNMYLLPIKRPTDSSSALAFSKELDILQFDLGFNRSRDYNLQRLSTKTAQEDAVLMLSADVMATNTNYNLAFAFNKSYIDLMNKGQLIRLGSKGLADNKVYGIYTDTDYFRINNVEGFPTAEGWFNPQNLEEKRWVHNWKAVTFSYASNAIAFVDPDDVGVASVSITLDGAGDAITAKKGTWHAVDMPKVTASAGKICDSFCSFALTGNTSANTYIDDDGSFYVGSDETGTLTITATSHLDNTVSGTATVTVA